MTNEAMLDAVQQALADGRISLPDLAKTLGMSEAAMASQPGNRLVMSVMAAGIDIASLMEPVPSPPEAAPKPTIDTQQLVEALGRSSADEPLATLLAQLGVPTGPPIQPTHQLGELDLHFTDGRLSCVGFGADFDGALPFDLTWEGELPYGFMERPGGDMEPGSNTLHQDGFEICFLTDHGMRFHLSVKRKAPPQRPLVPKAAPPPPPTAPPKGAPLGYKTSWLAVRSDDVAQIARIIGARGDGVPCSANEGIRGGRPFVSAARDGWRIVTWAADDVDHGLSLAQRLSRSLETDAGYFASDRVIDQYAWARFERGTAVRVLWTEDGTVHRDEGPRQTLETTHIDEDLVHTMAAALATAPVVPLADGLRFD